MNREQRLLKVLKEAVDDWVGDFEFDIEEEEGGVKTLLTLL